MATPTFLQQWAVKETTVLRLDADWSMGVEWIAQGEYTDASGHQQTGFIARVGVWCETSAQSETLEVFEGAVFQAGSKSYQVLELKPNTSLSAMPGSSNGFMVIGLLP